MKLSGSGSSHESKSSRRFPTTSSMCPSVSDPSEEPMRRASRRPHEMGSLSISGTWMHLGAPSYDISSQPHRQLQYMYCIWQLSHNVLPPKKQGWERHLCLLSLESCGHQRGNAMTCGSLMIKISCSISSSGNAVRLFFT